MDNPTHCWAPRPIRPIVPMQRIRQYTYVFSSVCPGDGDQFSMILPYADTERMDLYLDGFAKHLGDDAALLIMDQAAWHKTEPILCKRSNLIIAFLPPYSPELNPAEHFWGHLRRHYMKNHYWESMEQLEDALEQALCTCLNERDAIRSLTAFSWMEGL
jgi:hypothetical protein